MGGLVIGKPVAVVSKVENSVAFLHLQYQNFFQQRPKSKFGLSLLGTHIGNCNLDQYFQSTDFLVDLMSYMLRCTMLLVKVTTRTAFFTLQWCRNTRVVDVARFSPLKIPLTMIYSKIRRPLQTVESPFIILDQLTYRASHIVSRVTIRSIRRREKLDLAQIRTSS